MARIKLAESSVSLISSIIKTLRKPVRLNTTVLATTLVVCAIGFYALILLSSNEKSTTDFISAPPLLLLPDSKRVEEFYRAQAGQDKWIFENLFGSNVDGARNRGGFFIEFGARNGVEHSNTYFFETFLGWYGLLIEANPKEQGNIVMDRPASAVVNGAVCEKQGGTVTFFDANKGGWGGVKTLYDSQRLADTEYRV